MTERGNEFAGYRAREFAWSGQRVYLNAASFGPLPDRSKHAIDAFNARRWDAAMTDEDFILPQTRSRAAAAALIGAESNEIALTPNTNIGINIAATAAFQAGDDRRVILISDREFPANVYPWLALARQDFSVEIIPTDDAGFPREDEMLERIEEGDVAAVSVSFVQYSNGFRADTETLGTACRRNGTLFVVDAIQGVGAVPIDVRASAIDILACGGQKWLCSPWGSGFTYVRRDLITEFEPLLPGWISFEATQDFTRLTDYRYDMLEDARRFEIGSLAFQDFVGFHNSVELLLEIGVDRIFEHIRTLEDRLIGWAEARSIEVVSSLDDERRSGILCLQPPDVENVFGRLMAADVRCAYREGAIRFAPHWYNTMEEIERVIEVLDGAYVK
jgi:cysteine desulfurase / selenocysteine lyase